MKKDEEILKISYKRPRRFGELYERHNRRFFRIAQTVLRSKEDAEDVVQETFIRIYKYGRNFSQNGGNFRPWANTILKNCIADQINKYKNATVSLTEEIENTSPDLATDGSLLPGEESISAASLEDKNKVRQVLKKIGGTSAEMIKLRYLLGKSFKEISRILNIKNSTARVRVHRSKKLFMEVYRRLGFQ